MKGFCKEFGEHHKVEVTFASEGMPPTVPTDISLCLFRVMQEGLHNALKHSGVKLFDVKLLGSPTEKSVYKKIIKKYQKGNKNKI